MAVKIKVCGITNLQDAEKSLELGADILGFNFYPPSPRCIAPELAKEIIERLPSDVFNVALFVNEPRARVEEVLAACQLPDGRQGYRGLQFHGERLPGGLLFARFFFLRVWRLGADVPLGMAHRDRCGEYCAFGRAAGRQCRRSDSQDSTFRRRCLQRRGIAPRY